MIRATLWVTYL